MEPNRRFEKSAPSGSQSTSIGTYAPCSKKSKSIYGIVCRKETQICVAVAALFTLGAIFAFKDYRKLFRDVFSDDTVVAHSTLPISSTAAKILGLSYKMLIPSDRLNIMIEGETPLTKAVRNRNEDMVRALLEAGADLKIANQKGYTPLALAQQIENSILRDEIIALLSGL